jgi:hypothetical protein
VTILLLEKDISSLKVEIFLDFKKDNFIQMIQTLIEISKRYYKILLRKDILEELEIE